jgi:vacuolar-type H+-ATPase subunit H
MAVASSTHGADEASGSVEALRQLKAIENEGAARLAAGKAEGEQTLAAVRQEAEAAVLQARLAAEHEAEAKVQQARDAAEVEAQLIITQGERAASDVRSRPPSRLRDKQEELLGAILSGFRPSDG